VFVVAAAGADDAAVARGEKVFQYCYSCHSVEPGEMNLPGPNLRGIVGDKIAARAEFEYSPAMRAFATRDRRWSEELLDRYIARPQEVVPKTSMAFFGISEPDDRADLIAFLRSASEKR
jgi:cytochrome c